MSKFYIIIIFFILSACNETSEPDFEDRNLPKFDINKARNTVIVDVTITNGTVYWGKNKLKDGGLDIFLKEVLGLNPIPALVVCERERSIKNNKIYSKIEKSDVCVEEKQCYFVSDCVNSK